LLPDGEFNSGETFACRSCHSQLRVDTFPALDRGLGPTISQPILGSDEAGCFYHAQKAATVPCDGCGRFLCPLCAFDMGQETLCPSCIHSGIQKRTNPKLESRRNLPDAIALGIAVIPAVMVFPTLVTAPVAIGYSIYHWRSPLNLMGRSKVRFVAAILISAAEIGWWIFLAYLVMLALRVRG
jgi:hypothetical protein